MAGRPTLDEIEAMVERLEMRLAASPDADVQRLLDAAHKLDARFRADLADLRDLALSRGAVLMLAKFIADGGAG